MNAPTSGLLAELSAAATISPRISGAEAIVRSLLAEGVDLCFGYPGGAIMPLYDALFGFSEQLQHVLSRHEQGAIHAAQGYARATGRVGVAIATSGPGATNLVTGLADAFADSTPVVCIVGQVPSHLLGTDAFQETDVINITSPITKWNTQVTRAQDIPAAIAKAFYVARSGRPGPVLLDITKDAQQAFCAFTYQPCTGVRGHVIPGLPSRARLVEAAGMINRAHRPMIIAGQGVVLSGGHAALLQLAERTGIPVAWTLLGLDAFPSTHPLSLGMVGMHGRYAPNLKTAECDLLIAIGMRFDDRVTGDASQFAKQARIIHIERDPAELGKIIQPTVPLLGDARGVLEALLPMLEARDHAAWRASFYALDALEEDRVIQRDLRPQTGQLRMGEVVRALSDETAGRALIVTDVGQHQMAAARYCRFEAPTTSITSGGLGTMGFALPAAIGAKLGAPERTVIAIIGDGGFQMNQQELGMLLDTGAAVKIVILNNQFLGMVRQWQALFYESRYAQTEMRNPDFVRLAGAYGVPGLCVPTREDLPGAIAAMLACPGPFLLDVRVEREANVFPMVPAGAATASMLLEAP